MNFDLIQIYEKHALEKVQGDPLKAGSLDLVRAIEHYRMFPDREKAWGVAKANVSPEAMEEGYKATMQLWDFFESLSEEDMAELKIEMIQEIY